MNVNHSNEYQVEQALLSGKTFGMHYFYIYLPILSGGKSANLKLTAGRKVIIHLMQ